MKKLLLVLTLLLSVTVANATTGLIMPKAGTTVTQGIDFYIPFSATNSHYPWSIYQFTFQYDPAVIEPVVHNGLVDAVIGYGGTGDPSYSLYPFAFVESPGIVRVAGVHDAWGRGWVRTLDQTPYSNPTDEYVLCELKFKAIGNVGTHTNVDFVFLHSFSNIYYDDVVNDPPIYETPNPLTGGTLCIVNLAGQGCNMENEEGE